MNLILLSSLGMGLMGLFLAIILVVVYKKYQVAENPLIERVTAALPGVNCGACGYPGCAGLSEAIVEKGIDPSACPVSEDADRQEIAQILGREVKSKGIKEVAKLHCRGDKSNTTDRASYNGLTTCLANHITNGGTKSCLYGCLGLGDCVRVCPFDALSMAHNGLPLVNEEKCVACNKCVETCPRSLFKLVKIDQPVYVLCSSHDTGPNTKAVCKVGCTGCAICVKQVPNQTFTIHNHLSIVNYDAAKNADPAQLTTAVTKCPQKIINLR